MENLLGKFGRRIALLGGAIAVAAVAIALILGFTIKSNIAQAEDITWYNTETSYLTANVQAPKAATFTDTFTYTFEFVTTAAEEGQQTTPPVGLNIQPQDITVAVNDGELQQPAAPHANDKIKTRGKGTRNGEGVVSWEDTTTQGYIVSRQLKEFITLPESGTTDARQMFPANGFYQYKVTCTGSTMSGDSHYYASQSTYYIDIWIQEGSVAGTANILGMLFYQRHEDNPGNAVYVNKKNPTLEYGQSNVEYGVPSTEGQEPPYAETVWEGFTFTNWFNPDESHWYLSKTVTGSAAPAGQEFAFVLRFNNSAWTTSTPALKGFIMEVVDGADPVYKGVVNFTPGIGYQEASFNLQHNYRLVLDGDDHGQAASTSTLPVGTTYTYTETGVTDFTPKAHTVKDQTAGEGTDLEVDTIGESGQNLVVAYDETPGATQNLAAIIGMGLNNYSAVTNDYDYNPLGFLIDALPYALMIGLPVAAFIIWMVSRRKKYNK